MTNAHVLGKSESVKSGSAGFALRSGLVMLAVSPLARITELAQLSSHTLPQNARKLKMVFTTVIESHDAVVFLVSPDSVYRRFACSARTDTALECEKRLIAVLYRNVESPTTVAPQAVARLHGVLFLDPMTFADTRYGARGIIDWPMASQNWRRKLLDGAAWRLLHTLQAALHSQLWPKARWVAAGRRLAAVGMPLILEVPARP